MSTTSPNKGYTVPTVGGDTGTWGNELNTTLGIIDSNMGGNLPLTLSNANVTLNSTQAQNGTYTLGGTLTGNVTVTWPSSGGFYLSQNNTTGNFTVTAQVGTSSAPLPQNAASLIWTDGTTVHVHQAHIPGEYKWFAGATAPAGWLVCDGSSYSTTTYAALFAQIGYTYGGSGGNFNVPNAKGRTLVHIDPTGSVLSGVTSVGNTTGVQSAALNASQLPAHTHNNTLTDPGHAHGIHDPGHGHGITDPGHGHGITDPGHTHQTNRNQVDSGSGPAIYRGANNAGSFFGDMTTNTTNISINGATTGISVNSGTTGVTVNSGTTGITINNASFGSGSAVSLVQPVLAAILCIKY